jgi:glycosyltransferase involved in cell wall biosynthesis/ribosomal protein S18 acetylase RimI-like enzyme
MNTGFLIAEFGKNSSSRNALYKLLIRLDEFYIPRISSRTDLEEYSVKLLENGRVFYAVNDEGKYIGLLAVYVNDTASQCAFISTISVLPEYQGSGISDNLMLKAFEVAVENGMRSISLEVDLSNQRALAFYKKQGFRKERQVIDTLIMTRELSDFDNPAKPTVTISCLTYNHASFVRNAVESFLMQKTTFPFEILIHDDASTDGTADVIREYEQKYPALIFPIYQLENQYSKGVKISFTHQFPRARGKYIALCEGDDYWTDPLKLQKQVDFLEANPEYALCFHKVKNLVNNELQEEEVIEKRYQSISDKNRIGVLDLLEHGNFIHTCSVVYRNQEIGFPFELQSSPVGDYFLFILLSEKGLLHRIDEYMGVYRRGTGTHSTLSPLDMQRRKVQSSIAILSYLREDGQKQIFLQKTLSAFSIFETVVKELKYDMENIASTYSWKDIIKILLFKIRRTGRRLIGKLQREE